MWIWLHVTRCAPNSPHVTSARDSGELVEQLEKQSWPGNVRELCNVVERAARVGWTPQRVPVVRGGEAYSDARERVLVAWERAWIEELIAAHAGNISRAARAARMGRTRLRELARHHGIATRNSAPHIED